MAEIEASQASADGAIVSFPTQVQRTRIMFDRQELQAILQLYGIMVAAGEWRDYAIDMLSDKAVFSVFRRASEVPLYTIEKSPRHARRQGAYAIVAAGGRMMKRGHDLRQVLRILVKKPKLVT